MTVAPGTKFVICEYCGMQNDIGQFTMNAAVPEEYHENNAHKSNVIILSIPSCGSTIFAKKVFNVYTNYAELVDAKSKEVEIHIDYYNVKKRISLMTNLIFKMNSGERYVIKALTQKNLNRVQQALSGLV